MADERQALEKDSGRTEPCNWLWNAGKVSWSPPFHPKLPRVELKKRWCPPLGREKIEKKKNSRTPSRQQTPVNAE
jgi:hypothetical protein